MTDLTNKQKYTIRKLDKIAGQFRKFMAVLMILLFAGIVVLIVAALTGRIGTSLFVATTCAWATPIIIGMVMLLMALEKTYKSAEKIDNEG